MWTRDVHSAYNKGKKLLNSFIVRATHIQFVNVMLFDTFPFKILVFHKLDDQEKGTNNGKSKQMKKKSWRIQIFVSSHPRPMSLMAKRTQATKIKRKNGKKYILVHVTWCEEWKEFLLKHHFFRTHYLNRSSFNLYLEFFFSFVLLSIFFFIFKTSYRASSLHSFQSTFGMHISWLPYTVIFDIPFFCWENFVIDAECHCSTPLNGS